MERRRLVAREAEACHSRPEENFISSLGIMKILEGLNRGSALACAGTSPPHHLPPLQDVGFERSPAVAAKRWRSSSVWPWGRTARGEEKEKTGMREILSKSSPGPGRAQQGWGPAP